jgi:hypothetical protein
MKNVKKNKTQRLTVHVEGHVLGETREYGAENFLRGRESE